MAILGNWRKRATYCTAVIAVVAVMECVMFTQSPEDDAIAQDTTAEPQTQLVTDATPQNGQVPQPDQDNGSDAVSEPLVGIQEDQGDAETPQEDISEQVDYSIDDESYATSDTDYTDSASNCSYTPVNTGGSISTIINRESGGDPYAENGQYKGIGQLSESYYETYLGMNWKQVRGNYNLQLEAMEDYINARYGSVNAAVAHSNAYGWY